MHAKSNYFKGKILENKDYTRNLWKLLRQSAPAKPSLKALTTIEVNEEYVSDPEKIADVFNEFFTSSAITSEPPDDLVTTQSELDALLLNFVNTRIHDEVQFYIPPITKDVIEADLKKIPSNKATGLDGISIRILTAISMSVAHVYSTSINQGIFPTQQTKEATIVQYQEPSLIMAPSNICFAYTV